MKYERWKEPFDRAGEWLVRRFPGLLVGKQGQQNAASLKMLRTTKNTITLQAYYERKFSRMLMFLFGGLIFLGFLALGFQGEVHWLERPSIERPGYGEGNLEAELTPWDFLMKRPWIFPSVWGNGNILRRRFRRFSRGFLSIWKSRFSGKMSRWKRCGRIWFFLVLSVTGSSRQSGPWTRRII